MIKMDLLFREGNFHEIMRLPKKNGDKGGAKFRPFLFLLLPT